MADRCACSDIAWTFFVARLHLSWALRKALSGAFPLTSLLGLDRLGGTCNVTACLMLLLHSPPPTSTTSVPPRAGWSWATGAPPTNELESVTTALRAHPDVLALRWQVYSQAKHWDLAL